MRSFTSQKTIVVVLCVLVLMFLLMNIALHDRVTTLKKDGAIWLLSNNNSTRQTLEVHGSHVGSIAEPIGCTSPSHRHFPWCSDRWKLLEGHWRKLPCVWKTHRVNGSQCSLYDYLTKVERVCVGKKEIYENKQATIYADPRYDIDELMSIMSDPNYEWLRDRIRSMWPKWIQGAKQFFTNRPPYRKRNIVIYMASLWYEPEFFTGARNGGPLGELVQWSDLIAGNYILGYNITLVRNVKEALKYINVHDDKRCAPTMTNTSMDVLYTDIVGTIMFEGDLGRPSLDGIRCHLRVLDSFGTYPEFNYRNYPEELKGRNAYGNRELLMAQFLTLYPHTHDNNFLGFVVNIDIMNNSESKKKNMALIYGKKNMALIYGKKCDYLKGHERYITIVSEYFEVHATCVENEWGTKYLPSLPFIINHGVVNANKLRNLLTEAKLFVGLGFPYEGPAPLEAMATGTPYLQPRFDVPLNKMNTPFFDMKPTMRSLTSQNPYMEEFIGEPYCFTLNVTDEKTLRETLMKIRKMETIPPRIPREFTTNGMIQRIFVFNEHLDFCNPYAPRWPPLDRLLLYYGQLGQSCKETCMSKKLVCERSFFNEINLVKHLERYGKVKCKKIIEQYYLHAPSIDPSSNTCYIQNHMPLFSCSHGDVNVRRLCPCRDYEYEHSAICKNCL